jgi:hypothetical protein
VSGGAHAVTVVWVAPVEGREDAARALKEWGHARGLAIVAATESASRASIAVDPTIADRVEKDLERAKEALAANDADAAERALARAEAALRDHPELPQAAWLRAEVDRTWAARFLRLEPRDEARARAAAQEADALDGGRVPGIGEAPSPAPLPGVSTRIVVHGAGAARADLRFDGAPLTPKTSSDASATYVVDARPAEHQLVAYVLGEPAFASWVSIAPPGGTAAAIDVHLGAGGRCDASAFAGVTRDAKGVHAAGVGCDRWVAALPGPRPGSVLVARCERDACGPILEWRTAPIVSGPPQGGSVERARGAWPSWATWTLVGVGAAAVTTVALVATGSLEARENETRFVAGGVRTQAR